MANNAEFVGFRVGLALTEISKNLEFSDGWRRSSNPARGAISLHSRLFFVVRERPLFPPKPWRNLERDRCFASRVCARGRRVGNAGISYRYRRPTYHRRLGAAIRQAAGPIAGILAQSAIGLRFGDGAQSARRAIERHSAVAAGRITRAARAFCAAVVVASECEGRTIMIIGKCATNHLLDHFICFGHSPASILQKKIDSGS